LPQRSQSLQKERLVNISPGANRAPQAEKVTQAEQSAQAGNILGNIASRPGITSQSVPEQSVSNQVAQTVSKDPGRRKSKRYAYSTVSLSVWLLTFI
jgi:hypothetical protein